MMRGMFAAISGLRNHQVALDVTANDIANVNTIGYKSARPMFKDSLSQLQRGGAGATANNGGATAAQVGLGVSLGSIDNSMASGAMQSTGNPLDVAIQGEGFFRVAPAAPPAAPTTGIEYTRAGNFARNEAGYLTTQEGYYVLGRTAPFPGGADSLIGIPPDATGVAISQDGSVSYIPAGGGARQVAGYIALATFPNAAGLERASGNSWILSANYVNENLGTPGLNVSGLTTAGAVEMSNVDLAQAFTNMITAQRGFQANSRIIGVSDEMLQELVNLKR